MYGSTLLSSDVGVVGCGKSNGASNRVSGCFGRPGGLHGRHGQHVAMWIRCGRPNFELLTNAHWRAAELTRYVGGDVRHHDVGHRLRKAAEGDFQQGHRQHPIVAAAAAGPHVQRVGVGLPVADVTAGRSSRPHSPRRWSPGRRRRAGRCRHPDRPRRPRRSGAPSGGSWKVVLWNSSTSGPNVAVSA